MTARKLAIVVAVACSISGTAEATTNLKPFDPVALQSVVEATAKELLLPGAMGLAWNRAPGIAVQHGAKFGGALPQPFIRLEGGTRMMCREFRVGVGNHCQHFRNCLDLGIPAR
ncbi:MAG: hypothetical protein ACLP4V_27750 [Methylocella sp.]